MTELIFWSVYIAIGLLTWPRFTKHLFDWATSDVTEETWDYVVAGVLGLIAAALWPVMLAIITLGWLVTNPLRRWLFGADR